jgi:archaemetzincin
MKQQLGRRLILTSAALEALMLGCNQAPSGPAAPPASTSPGEEKPATLPSRSEKPSQESVGRGEDSAQEPQKPQEAPETTPLLQVYLQPLGDQLPSEDVTYIRRALDVFYPLSAKELGPKPLPTKAYSPPRQRYRAEKLLDFLKSEAPEDSHVIIGLTDVDISTTKGKYEDWGILGLASIAGGECVISRFRAKREARDDLHTRQRLAKTVVHEVGHTLGLLHCPNYGCLMEDGQGSVKTTDHEYDLCDECRARLGDRARPRDLASIPWPRP